VSTGIRADELGTRFLLEVNALVVQEVTALTPFVLDVFFRLIWLESGGLVPAVLLVGRDIFTSFFTVILIVIIIKLISIVFLPVVFSFLAVIIHAGRVLLILREFIVDQGVIIETYLVLLLIRIIIYAVGICQVEVRARM